jgi:type I restriction enzyme S subunit
MKEPENRGRVPRLRFPEFREAGEWVIGKVEDLITTVTPPKRLLTTEYLNEGRYPVIDQSQKEFSGWTNDTEALINDELPWIIFGDHTCILKIARRPFVQGADGIKIFKPTPSLETEYLYQCLQFNPIVMEEYKRHFATLKNKIMGYPVSRAEQQKIADCLSSIDDLITLESQKLNALKTHKKGLMQQLFPAEGETVPRLRFPEFSGLGGWHVKRLDLCLDYEQPAQYIVSSTQYLDSYETPVLTAGKTFILGYTNETTGIYKDNLPVIVFDDFTTACKFVDFPFKVKSSAIKILTSRGGSNIKFMYELLSMVSYEVGAHERHWISKFAPMVVLVPGPVEQQWIADCLSSLDDLITAQAQKVETLKTHKKGLMQQLFPALDEVSA